MEGKTQEPQPRKFVKAQDLSRLEHLLIGSSIPGESISRIDVARQVESGGMKRDLLIPLGFKFPLPPEEVRALQERRERQQDLRGLFPFLSDTQFDLMSHDATVRFQPIGLIDETTGEIDPVWRLSVVDDKTGQEIGKNDLGKYISLSDEYESILFLQDEDPGAKTLHLKGSEKK